MIIYERIKCDKRARVLLIDKAKEIIDRYRIKTAKNLPGYVFPLFTL